ncbi:MAG: Fic family protein [Candidatus Saganbacteria bacterium]|nr:Fic family protein [Candidatus Saganbacteria bacterium]
MNMKDFKAGTYKQQYEYKSFLPAKVNQPWIWDDAKINVLLEKATRALGELNAFSLIVPDVDLFIQMHIVKEAQTSSRIEGTKTNMDEALMAKEDLSPEKRDDWQEVQNYIKAMNFGIKQLEKLPLSNRLLRDMHKILMTGVRGEHKYPGEFRKSQNWIGGSSISDAVYVPPHHDDLPDLMSDFEKFLHNDAIDVPHLIKIAISHYQFESVHPFLDGNGRIGRLLITFYLVSHNLLIKPSLYLSAFFEKHKPSYYDALLRVRDANDMAHWVKFFLNAVIETAGAGKETFQGILKLKDKVDAKIVTLGRKAETGRQFIHLLYKKPVITANDVGNLMELTPKSANALIRDFEKLGIIKEITGHQRNRIFEFKEYLALFKKG